MKRLLIACLLTIATCGLALVTADPAGADTTCSIANRGTPLAVRTCQSDPATAGGVAWNGHVRWWYLGNNTCPAGDPCGTIWGTVTDTVNQDYSCAWVSLEWDYPNGNVGFGPKRISPKVCGTGPGAYITLDFNCISCYSDYAGALPYHTDGTYKIFVKTDGTSGRFFLQDAAVKGVNT